MLKLMGMLISSLWLASCIDVPIVLKLSETFKFEDSDLEDLTNKILDKLKNFRAGGTLRSAGKNMSANTCETDLNAWLEKRFNEGFLPADVILPSEYLAPGRLSGNPDLADCLPIDLNQQFSDLIAEPTSSLSNIKLSLKSMADSFNKTECAKAFLDPANKKIKISAMNMEVIENTLTYDFSPIYFFSSPTELDDEIQKKLFDELLNQNDVYLLGTAPSIKPKILGTFSIPLNTDQDVFKQAQDAIVPLTGDILAVPGGFTLKPKKIKIAERDYFIIPKGHIYINFSIDTDIRMSIIDGKCVLDKFNADIESQRS